MDALERRAEARIGEAIERGELDDLPGAGRPLQLDDGSELVAPELRVAYRILKNAGFVPEEVTLRREISDVRQLISAARNEEERLRMSQRLEMLLYRIGGERSIGLQLHEQYFQRLAQRVGGSD